MTNILTHTDKNFPVQCDCPLREQAHTYKYTISIYHFICSITYIKIIQCSLIVYYWSIERNVDALKTHFPFPFIKVFLQPTQRTAWTMDNLNIDQFYAIERFLSPSDLYNWSTAMDKQLDLWLMRGRRSNRLTVKEERDLDIVRQFPSTLKHIHIIKPLTAQEWTFVAECKPEILAVEVNRLTDIDFGQMPSLRFLYLSHVCFEDWSPRVLSRCRLEFLCIGHVVDFFYFNLTSQAFSALTSLVLTDDSGVVSPEQIKRGIVRMPALRVLAVRNVNMEFDLFQAIIAKSLLEELSFLCDFEDFAEPPSINDLNFYKVNLPRLKKLCVCMSWIDSDKVVPMLARMFQSSPITHLKLTPNLLTNNIVKMATVISHFPLVEFLVLEHCEELSAPTNANIKWLVLRNGFFSLADFITALEIFPNLLQLYLIRNLCPASRTSIESLLPQHKIDIFTDCPCQGNGIMELKSHNTSYLCACPFTECCLYS